MFHGSALSTPRGLAYIDSTIYFSAIKSSKESTDGICSSLLAPEGQRLIMTVGVKNSSEKGESESQHSIIRLRNDCNQ